ncbi:hypothetical protein [Castellaniella sp. GW247-6E4]|uniref:hypothetical protein n=1 Tax=Castellaniella sp. GW247-6E4 TaxID=3140380 RepID=UPI00331629B6
MAYFHPPQERPRRVKRFLTVRDIEDAAASGCREIVHVDDLVITDAAREAAHDLGVAIVKPDPARSASPPPTPTPASASAPPVGQPFTPAPQQAVPPLQAAPAPYAASRPPAASAAFMPPPGAHADEHPLVQDLARAIHARWRPVRRRQRQLLA